MDFLEQGNAKRKVSRIAPVLPRAAASATPRLSLSNVMLSVEVVSVG